MAPPKKYLTIEDAQAAKAASKRAYRERKRAEAGESIRAVGRPRIHATNADRTKAYRERQKQKMNIETEATS